jgi:hypothetical protein
MFMVECKGETFSVGCPDGFLGIGRPGINYPPSHTWELLGLERHNNFGHCVECLCQLFPSIACLAMGGNCFVRIASLSGLSVIRITAPRECKCVV